MEWNNTLLIPTDLKKKKYDGYLHFAGKDYRLQVHLEKNNSLETAVLKGDWKLKLIFGGFQDAIKQRLKQSPNLDTLITEISDLIEKGSRHNAYSEYNDFHPALCANLVQEITKVGWNRLHYVSTSLDEVHFEANDEKFRKHILKIKFPAEFPEIAPVVHTDLPEPIPFEWNKEKKLVDIYENFVNELKSYDRFWTYMDEIDNETWVLEPEIPQRKDSYRRIALGQGTSLLLEVDPKRPQEIPSCRFLGLDIMVKPHEMKLHHNLHSWDTNLSILSNLRNILTIDFPSKSTIQGDFMEECGICYSYKFNGNIPDKVCEDHRCCHQFHTECLYEWLRGLATSLQSFNLIFGNCPYCDKPISCKMPSG